jgi:hypothetical protein
MKRVLQGLLMVAGVMVSQADAQVSRNLEAFESVCPAVSAVSSKVLEKVFSAEDLKREVDRVFTKHQVRVDCQARKRLSLLVSFRTVFEDDFESSIYVYSLNVTGLVEQLQTKYLGYLRRVSVWDRASTYWVRKESLSKQGILDNVQRGLSPFVDAWKATRPKAATPTTTAPPATPPAATGTR